MSSLEMDTVIRVETLDSVVCFSNRERYESNSSPSSYGQIVGQIGFFKFSMTTDLGEGNLWIETC